MGQPIQVGDCYRKAAEAIAENDAMIAKWWIDLADSITRTESISSFAGDIDW
jgi:hypothetical protein